MANRSRVIALSVNDLKELERLVRASSTPAGLSRRARAILLMSEGLSGVEVADKTGYTDVQVSRIRRLCLLFIHPRASNLISFQSAGTMPA